MTEKTLVLHTGGTIGMEPSADGYLPVASFGAYLREALTTHVGRQLPDFDIVELDSPIDSANLRPSMWIRIAEILQAQWDDYDGFVVLHGTDTLAWSASALSFLLQGCDKPVIFTGSQIPLSQPRTDAFANVETALLLASRHAVPEVGLFFGRQLLRGNRSTKVATSLFEAFASPNAPALADVGIDITVHDQHVLPSRPRHFTLPPLQDDAVSIVTVHPGISGRIIESLVDHGQTRGLILRSYGLGNVPDCDTSFLAALERACAAGIVVLNTTQCATGSLVHGTYATSAALDRLGVVSGGDMTLEAAFAKLHVVLAQEGDPDRWRQHLRTPLCGELTKAD